MVEVGAVFTAHKTKHLIGLHGFRLHVANGGVQKPARLASGPRQHVQYSALVQVCQAGNGVDADAFSEHVQHRASLAEIHPQIVQRLLFRKRRAAFQALVTLDVEVFVLVKPAPFGNSIAANTVQSCLSRQGKLT